MLIASTAVPAAADSIGGRSDQLQQLPTAATVRLLGDIVPGTCPGGFLPYSCKPPVQGFPYPDYSFPLTVPGLGIPLGGIGAGGFMINQSGTFGPWFFGGSQSSSWEVRALPQAALHIREQIGNQPAQTRTLATDGPHATDYKGAPLPARSWQDPLPAWNRLQTGDADYAALYPFGTMTYKTFQSKISTRFYSPMVPGNDRLSSLPVAYFDVRIANTTNKTAKISTMFTMPNVAGHEDRQPATVREGLNSRYTVDRKNRLHAVTLSADADNNTPDAYKSEWTIAAKVGKGQSFSYTTSWDGGGDGSDVYAPFSDHGALPDRPVDASSSAGAIAVSAQLKPGKSTTIPFVLSWDFPQVAFANNNTVWMRRYTNFYGAKTTPQNDYIQGSYPFHQSYPMARDALVERSINLAAVERWWKPIATSKQYPDWLKEAALNQLANVPFHTSLWEGGLVRNLVPATSGDRVGNDLPGTHNYLGLDSNAGGDSTLGQGGEIGIYSHQVYSDFFPSIERDRMRAKVEAIMAPGTPGDPGDFGMTGSTIPTTYQADGDPFITWNQQTAPGPGQVWFLDRPAENVFRLYDYSQRHDPKFLRYAYPAMRKALDYLQATIPSDAALPEVPSANHPSPDLKSPFAMSNVYNGVPSNRFDSYVSGLYIVALETMIEASQKMGEPRATIATLRRQLQDARADYDRLFWNAEGGYYRYTVPEPGSSGDQVMLATFLPQYLAERAGLPDVVAPDRYRRHLKVMYGLVTGAVDSQGRPTGATLLGSSTTGRAEEIWPAANYAAAANYVSAGRRFHDPDLTAKGLSLGRMVARQIWDVRENGFEFNAPITYGPTDPGTFVYPSFENNLAVWQLVDVLQPGARRRH